MAIGRMEKVLLLGYWKERDPLLEDLQKAEIFHVREIAEMEGVGRGGVSGREGDIITRAELERARDFMARFQTTSKGFSLQEKLLSRADYENIRRTRPAAGLVREVDGYRSRLEALDREQKEREEENRRMDLWRNVTIQAAGLETARALLVTGEIPSGKLIELEADKSISWRELARDSRRVAVVVAIHRDDVNQVLPWIESMGFRQVNYRDIARGTSGMERHEANLHRIHDIIKERASLYRELSLRNELVHDLEVLVQVYDDLERRREAMMPSGATERAFVLGGWVRAADMKRLEEILASYPDVVLRVEHVGKDDEPPVSLRNPRVFSPFELLTRMYGYPSYRGIDPSAFLSFFFVLFFGTAMTDAGYGVILSIASIVLLKKSSIPKDFLMILFWGGILSIVMGLATGGIFGDLFRLENPYMPRVFGRFRNFFTVMDPMVSPMRFFRFVLLVGVIQIFFGQIIGLWEALRDMRWGDALVDCLAWIMILGSIITILFSSPLCVSMALVEGKTAPLDSWLTVPAKWTFGAMAAVIILFGARNEKSWFFRILIGVLRLLVLSGLFSYVGDILSYIRLMALGMVTGGIGMAINAIAFMAVDVPVVGVLIAVLILIGGHIFNMVIGVLGSFVHSLRLQYVEFFSKFYAGGGKAFAPLSHSQRYMKLIE